MYGRANRRAADFRSCADARSRWLVSSLLCTPGDICILRRHEVEAGSAKLLRLAAAVGDPALLEGANDLRQGMTLLALVEAGMAASAQFRAFEPVEHE